jgi:hypothetical protein
MKGIQERKNYGDSCRQTHTLFLVEFKWVFSTGTTNILDTIVEITNTMHKFLILFLSVICYIYFLDKPPYRSVFSRNSDGSRSSLKMADYCRNM